MVPSIAETSPTVETKLNTQKTTKTLEGLVLVLTPKSVWESTWFPWFLFRSVNQKDDGGSAFALFSYGRIALQALLCTLCQAVRSLKRNFFRSAVSVPSFLWSHSLYVFSVPKKLRRSTFN